MSSSHTRNEFAPPPTPGLVRALALAIVAHALLLLVLAVGVQWKRDAAPVTVEAELWSAVPEQAAPPAPEPVAPPEPAIPPPPAPKPTVAPPAPPVPRPDPSIAIAKEKARLQKEKQAQQDKLEEEKRQKEALQKQKLQEAKDAREKAARDKAKREQEARDKAQTDKAKAANEAKNLAQLRQQQLERIARMAGAAAGNGDANSTGSAKQSSGPSAGYAGRLRARIKPNITYTEPISGNPAAEVEVRTAPTGTIINRKLVKSSGVKSWDDAVLSAIDKTETLPPDVDGRVPSSLLLVFRPKD